MSPQTLKAKSPDGTVREVPYRPDRDVIGEAVAILAEDDMPTGDDIFGEGDQDGTCPNLPTREVRTSAHLPTPAPLWEAAPDFLARVGNQPPKPMLIDGLLPADGISLWHAHPRSLKSWLALEAAICIPSKLPACGRCTTTEAPVIYVSNEDSQQRTAQRVRLLLAGHGRAAAPADLYFAVHVGVCLDDPEWQDGLILAVQKLGIKLVILDPLRSLTAAVDAGPKDLQPFALYLRRLVRETGTAVLALHHDAKPVPGQRDDRRRPHRASGGGLFSIADAPVHLERVGDEQRVIVTPTAWKFASDPPPLEITLEVTAEAATLRAEPTTGGDADTIALHERIETFVKATPGLSSSKVAAGLHGNRQAILAALEELAQAERLTCVPKGQAKLWYPGQPTGSRFWNRSELEPVPGSTPCKGGTGTGTGRHGGVDHA